MQAAHPQSITPPDHVNMSKTLAVFGATGHQGSSVIDNVLRDPELSRQYKLRAITRDVNSDKAKQLKDKVEVVRGDVLDRASLETALAGAHTVFAMTTPTFAPNGFEVEYNSAKRIADVAVEKGATYIIFSTLPSATEVSGGKYTNIIHFEAKAKAEQYIRGLPIKSAFFAPGFFMENFQHLPFLVPRPASDGTWVISLINSPKTRIPMIDAVGDSGKFVGAILAEPDKYQGKTFCAATEFYSWEEAVAIMSKATGKVVKYKRVSVEEFTSTMPFMKDTFAEALKFPEEFGLYGPDSEGMVAWSAENARGRLSTFEEFLEAHPLQLA